MGGMEQPFRASPSFGWSHQEALCLLLGLTHQFTGAPDGKGECWLVSVWVGYIRLG